MCIVFSVSEISKINSERKTNSEARRVDLQHVDGQSDAKAQLQNPQRAPGTL